MRTLSPRFLLRLEGAALLAACVWAYAALRGDWRLFALLLAPDLSGLGYLVNKDVGAATYNAAHTSGAPLLLGLASFGAHHPVGLWVCAIRLAPIGLDRMLGYGLKYPTAFQDTHLQRV